MSPRGIFSFVLGLVVVGILVGLGVGVYQAGLAQGIVDAGRYPAAAAVPVAGFGSNFGLMLLLIGMIMGQPALLLLGIILFAGVVVFQLVNLPVEFDASNRAKALLVSHGIVHQEEMHYVNKVLNAAALTYVAATLQAVLTLVYYLIRYSAMSRDE